MKPFLGVNITEDKKNTAVNGEELIAQRTSQELLDTLEQAYEKGAALYEKSSLPLIVRIIQWLGGFAALMLVTGLIRADVTISQAYKNAPWLFWLGGAGFIVWLMIFIIAAKKQKKAFSSEESERLETDYESVSRSVYNELGVPSGAKDVDILSFYYKIKDGEPKAVEKSMTKYINDEYKIFSDGKSLIIANLECKYAIPLSSIKSIKTVKKRIIIPMWNKEEEPKKGEYKQYKLQTDDSGRVSFKHCHILEFEYGEDTWGIYIPPYELPAFEALTHLTASE